MTVPEVGKCYNSTHVKSKKVEYVGKFKERRGGGRYDPSMGDYFTLNGKEKSVIHSEPGEYTYTETECQGTNAVKSRRARKYRKNLKRKQRKTRKN